LGSRWWSAKIQRTWVYLHAQVDREERTALAGWLTPAQIELFDSMPVADRRHGLDVMATLTAAGSTDPDLLTAGLLHDCGKGPRVRLVHRVTWSLGQRYGTWIWRWAVHLPTFEAGLARMRHHAIRSAELAAQAGCSPHTVELIRNEEAPTDDAGRLLLAADEAN
jgi:hypothetical protein